MVMSSLVKAGRDEQAVNVFISATSPKVQSKFRYLIETIYCHSNTLEQP